jgi:hypothetical protein
MNPGLTKQETVDPGREQPPGEAGAERRHPRPRPPPSSRERAAEDPGHHHRRRGDGHFDGTRRRGAELQGPETMDREQDVDDNDGHEEPGDEAPRAAGPVAETRQLARGVHRRHADDQDDRNPVVAVPPVERRSRDELGLRRQTENPEIEARHHRAECDQRNEHEPGHQEVAKNGAGKRPHVGGPHARVRVEEFDQVAQPRDGVRLGTAAELLHRIGAVTRAGAPRGQPAADVAAAGDGREIVEAAEDARPRESLQHTETKAGAAHTAARETERGMACLLVPRVRVAARQTFSAVQVAIFLLEHLIEGAKGGWRCRLGPHVVSRGTLASGARRRGRRFRGLP